VTAYTVNDGNGGNNYAVTLHTAAGTITAASLNIHATTDSRTYDGTTSSSAVPTYTGIISPDTVTGLSQAYQSKNVLGANGSTLDVTAYTVNDGNGGNNYAVTLHTATGTITAASLNISATTDSRTYDGTTSSSAVPTYTGIISPDTVTGLSQAYQSKNVLGANGSTLDVTAYTVNDGNGGNNYAVTLHTAAGTITAASLNIHATTDSKTYDGTTSSSAVPTYTGIISPDTVTGLTQAYQSKNVLGANGSTLDVTAYTVNDGNGGNNYVVTLHTATGTITAASLNIHATTDSKTYDGTTSSSAVPTYTGIISPDTVTGLTQAYQSKNVLGANGSTLDVTAYTVNDGNGGNNYAVTLHTANGTISTRTLNIYATTDSRTYDGTTASSAVPTYDGLQSGDSLTAIVQVFDSRNAGSRTLSIAGYNLSDGNSGNNYSVTTHTAAGTINTLALTINAVAGSKTYDGNATSGGAPTFVTLVGGDMGSAVQVFDSRNAGSRTLSVLSYTISDGNGGANYGPITTHTAAGTINTLALTINAVADSKTYDGNAASGAAPSFVTLVGGDTGSAVQVFDNKNAGSRTLSVTSYTISDGNGGANYGPITTHTASGTINTLTLTINAVADSKTYNGNAASCGAPIFVTLVGGDTGSAVQVFDNKNAGSRTLSVLSYTINDGNGGANYGPVTAHTAAGTINTLALTINAVADSKTYNGNTTSSGTPSFVTLVGGDTGSAVQVFDSRNAGSRTLSVSSYTINDGNTGANYGPVTLHTAAGTINTLALTINAVADSKTYNGNTASSGVPSFVTLVGGDTGTGVQVFDSRNAGARTLSVSSYTISDGNAGANYGPVTTNTAAGSISQRALTITAVTNTKTYDCATSAAATPTVSGVQNGDTVTGLAETYASANAGTGKTLNVTSYTVNDGNAGNNYIVSTVPSNAGVINQAHATFHFTAYHITYDLQSHTATGTATGVCSENLNSLLDLSGTTHTLPGNYTDTWSFAGNANYASDTGTVNNSIGYGTCTGPNGPGRVILQPINADGTSVVKQGSTVPVKFTICDANGNPISNPMAVFGNTTGTITLLNTVRGTVDNVNENTGGDIPDVAFRYSSGIWIFNMATTNMNKNTTYYFRIPLADGSYILFQFGTK
jgi:hypothetical protein